jgi:hypothetical protein
MLPPFILDEVARRLASSKLSATTEQAVCRAVGIDLDVALARQPGDNSSVELLPYTSKSTRACSGSISAFPAIRVRGLCRAESSMPRQRPTIMATSRHHADDEGGSPRLE